MRRIWALLLGVLLVLGFSVPVSAANEVTRGDMTAIIDENGSCQVTLIVQLQLDYTMSSLSFPLPEDARSITVNGQSPRTSRSNGVTNVDLAEFLESGTGNFTLDIRYTLPDVVTSEALGGMQIDLPLLSGFSCPVNQLLFSVTLPAENSNNPSFSSGYYKQSIEASMQWDLLGTAVSGSVNAQLKDRETLTMTLPVEDDMFPQMRVGSLETGFENTIALVLGVLAVLYWLIFMRCAPLFRRRCADAPEGMTAGQLRCGLYGAGADLTMMVITWAQLGYILIHTNDHGRVMLHKRMEMGNERSSYEQRVFQSLFGKKTTLDGTGLQYALLYRKHAAGANHKELFRKRTGNPRVFRGLCAGIGVCFGITLGSALAGSALLGILWIVLMALFCGVSAWFIQEWVQGLHLHYRSKLGLALGFGGIWLLLALIGGIFTPALWMLLVQLVAGALCFYGGRRTPYGRQTAARILGLRSYLCRISPQELHRILRSDPDFFFRMAPYALALGIERRFAKRFGNRRLNACPWLTSGMDGHMTALEWAEFMRQTVSDLDKRQKHLPLERLTGK